MGIIIGCVVCKLLQVDKRNVCKIPDGQLPLVPNELIIFVTMLLCLLPQIPLLLLCFLQIQNPLLL